MLFRALCSISYPLVNSNWSYGPETPNLGRIWRFLEPWDLEIWRMTLKNHRAPLLCYFNFCASFRSHCWSQTGVTVQKRLSWVLTSLTLTFDLWPWPFAWTSLLSMVITPENFMMIRWWEHGEKGVTDGQTDRRTDGQMDGRTVWTSHIAAWSQLKTNTGSVNVSSFQIHQIDYTTLYNIGWGHAFWMPSAMSLLEPMAICWLEPTIKYACFYKLRHQHMLNNFKQHIMHYYLPFQ